MKYLEKEKNRSGRTGGRRLDGRANKTGAGKAMEGLARCGAALWDTGLNLLYPARCPICEELLPAGAGKVCAGCRKKLPYIREPLCKKCGKPLAKEEQEYCPDCGREKHLFLCGRAIFLYEKSFRRSVHRMKFQNRREYLDFYAAEMAREGERYWKAWKPQVLIPIPMNRKKRRERGFDQSRLLAGKIGRITGIPVDTKSLVRSRYTLPQKDLNALERKNNLRDAFTLCGREPIPEPVVLIDDIYTTGATMDAAAKALRSRGIRRIYFLVLCTGKGK